MRTPADGKLGFQVAEAHHVLSRAGPARAEVCFLRQGEVAVGFIKVIAMGEIADAAHCRRRAVMFRSRPVAAVAQIGGGASMEETGSDFCRWWPAGRCYGGRAEAVTGERRRVGAVALAAPIQSSRAPGNCR